MTMKQEDLHDKHNKYPEYKNFHLAHNYDTNLKIWKFAGYKCVKCGRILTQTNIVPRHEQNCKDINKVRIYKDLNEIDPSATILTDDGKVWAPYRF